MAARFRTSKLNPPFTVFRVISLAGLVFPSAVKGTLMVVVAIAMFLGLLAFGGTYFGWSDPGGLIKLALATSFILGVVSGYKVRD